MRNVIDTSELVSYAEVLSSLPDDLKKEQKKFMRKQGSNLRRKTAQQARATVRKTAVKRKKYQREAGHYHKSIKRGKLYEENGAQCIRVYSSDPVAHLIEDGYTPVLRNKRQGEKQQGKKVFEKARGNFESEFESATENMIDEVISNL